MAMATAMYYSGYDPFTLEPVSTVRALREKRQLKALVLYWDAEQWPLAREALRQAGRRDLIGSGANCLVPSDRAPSERAPSAGPAGAPRAQHSRRPVRQRKPAARTPERSAR